MEVIILLASHKNIFFYKIKKNYPAGSLQKQNETELRDYGVSYNCYIKTITIEPSLDSYFKILDEYLKFKVELLIHFYFILFYFYF